MACNVEFDENPIITNPGSDDDEDDDLLCSSDTPTSDGISDSSHSDPQVIPSAPSSPIPFLPCCSSCVHQPTERGSAWASELANTCTCLHQLQIHCEMAADIAAPIAPILSSSEEVSVMLMCTTS